ncbi:MAG: hypothetical protein AAFY16_12985 [Cyanobacteria bacterium J06642_3]
MIVSDGDEAVSYLSRTGKYADEQKYSNPERRGSFKSNKINVGIEY